MCPERHIIRALHLYALSIGNYHSRKGPFHSIVGAVTYSFSSYITFTWLSFHLNCIMVDLAVELFLFLNRKEP